MKAVLAALEAYSAVMCAAHNAAITTIRASVANTARNAFLREDREAADNANVVAYDAIGDSLETLYKETPMDMQDAEFLIRILNAKP